jgi:hypothetical protein
MTKPLDAGTRGLQPYYKVRIALHGGVFHLASRSKPERDDNGAWHADWIDDSRCGDTPGWIDWSAVTAIVWRWTE